MRFVVLLIGVVLAIVVATTSSPGDGEAVEPVSATDEPVIGTPIEPLPGSDVPQHQPFTPYDHGGPRAAWSYEQLTPEEKLTADRGLNEDQTQIQNGYAAASAALAERATAERAALQLGVDEPLDTTGVIP